MALPTPLNSVADLLAFTNFKDGPNAGVDSIADGTFLFSQFESALRQSRYEIYRKTVKKQNEDFAEDRLEEIREAELWLATARLFPKFGERIAIQTTDANLASVGAVLTGADTPPPSGPGSKGEFWTQFMVDRFRSFGLMLLESPSTRYTVKVGKDTSNRTNPFPCLAREAWGTRNIGNCSTWNI